MMRPSPSHHGQPRASHGSGGCAQLAPDPDLPSRDRLLDERSVAAWLARHHAANGPIEFDHFEQERVQYRVGKSLKLVFRVALGGRHTLVAAHMFRPGRSERAFLRAGALTTSTGPLRPVTHAPDLDTVFWTYPNDRRIADLHWLDAAPRSLARFLGVSSLQTRVVAYAPEKSAMVECRADSGKILAYAKVYSGEGAGRGARLWSDLARVLALAGSGHRIPRVLGRSRRHRTLLIEAIEGTRLADLDGPQFEMAIGRLGSALASFHVPSPADWPPFAGAAPERLAHAAATIARARPDLASPAHALAARLDSLRPRAIEPSVCLHGDLHPKNGILRRGDIVLIDLDQACAGPAAADIGSLLAYLTSQRELGLLPEDLQRRLAEGFLAGYAAVRELPPSRSRRWHTAATLMSERALRAVSRIRPAALGRLERLLTCANELLDGDCDA